MVPQRGCRCIFRQAAFFITPGIEVYDVVRFIELDSLIRLVSIVFGVHLLLVLAYCLRLFNQRLKHLIGSGGDTLQVIRNKHDAVDWQSIVVASTFTKNTLAEAPAISARIETIPYGAPPAVSTEIRDGLVDTNRSSRVSSPARRCRC